MCVRPRRRTVSQPSLNPQAFVSATSLLTLLTDMPSQTTWTNLNYSTLLVGVVLGLAYVQWFDMNDRRSLMRLLRSIYGVTVYHMYTYLRSPRAAADALRLRLYVSVHPHSL